MTEIVITDQPTIEQYTASQGDTTFPFHFPIYEDVDLKVNYQAIGTVVDDVGTLLVLNSDYVISGIGNAGGGTVVLKFLAASGAIVTLRRDRLFARSANLGQGGEFSTDDLNHDSNSLLMLAQQLKTKNNMRQLSYQESEVIPTGDEKLPKLAARQIWRKPPSGIGIEALDYDPQETIDAALLRAELKSNGVGEGASMVGTEGSGNVQQVVDNFLDFKADLKDTAHDKGASMVGVEGGTTVQAFINSYTDALVIPGIKSGMIVNQNITDPLHDVDISPGVFTAKVGITDVYLVNPSTFTKRIDAVWSPGSGNGGFPSALTLTTDTWYHKLAIGKPDGTFDSGWDTDIDGANLLADATGFTSVVRLMSVYYKTITAVDQIFPFHMADDGMVKWKAGAVLNYNGPSSTANRILTTLTTPLGISVDALVLIYVGGSKNIGSIFVYLTDPALDDVAPWDTNFTLDFGFGDSSQRDFGATTFVRTNTLSQIGHRIGSAIVTGGLNLCTVGWKEKRL